MKRLIYLVLAIAMVACSGKLQLGKKDRVVEIDTKYGAIKIKLYDETPLHRDNFVKLSHNKYFDGTIFHRVIDGFMIQGGDPDSKNAKSGVALGEGGPGYTIPAEFNPKLFHKRGVIAAAREGDAVNPKKESAGSQFYIAQGRIYTVEQLKNLQVKLNNRLRSKIFDKINRKYDKKLKELQQDLKIEEMNALLKKMDQEVDAAYKKDMIVFSPEQIKAYTTVGGIPHLDGNYTVFGEVIEGENIIDSIAKVKTDERDRPLKDIKMEVKILK